VSKLQPVRGTRDILGEEARRFSKVIDAFRRLAELYGFEEIITPAFEFTEVFKRTLGEASDVVAKEMYTFEDRGGESITLRPENTAGIVRAFLSEGMHVKGVAKLYAYGPMFRYERPQKGRFRQFHQLDAEILGAPEPTADVELIALGRHLLETLGLGESVRLHLNTLGDAESRNRYRQALVAYFEKHEAKLSEDSRGRLKKNPLRILDAKDAGDRRILEGAPMMADSLNDASKAFFADVENGLKNLGIVFTLDHRLVRGLDYYCHTAYEFITEDLGAQGTVIGGGRYDGLVEMMGGPPTPGTGWAAGIERLGMLLKNAPPPARLAVFIPVDEAAEALTAKLCQEARKAGVACEMAFRGNVKKRLEKASKQNARAAVLIGPDEMKKGAATVRDLDTGSQSEVAFASLVPFLAKAAER
jgi:histidyl-tRNA synthetase